jgi:hypothetical protein
MSKEFESSNAESMPIDEKIQQRNEYESVVKYYCGFMRVLMVELQRLQAENAEPFTSLLALNIVMDSKSGHARLRELHVDPL